MALCKSALGRVTRRGENSIRNEGNGARWIFSARCVIIFAIKADCRKGWDEMLDVCLLGTGGMMPLKNRFLASCILRLNGHCALLDCGEGTQVALKMSNFTFKPIDVLCVTHLHADHISGLPGLLLSMGNEGRTEKLMILGPFGIKEVVRCLRVIVPGLPFAVECVEMTAEEEHFSLAGFEITAFPVHHRVPCYGYVFEALRQGRFDVERAQAADIPRRYWNALQHGRTVEADGRVLTPDMVLGPARRGLKVTYCVDTRPIAAIAGHAKGSDLFICEGTFGDEEKRARAVETRHMTFREAAKLAEAAQPGELWLTHYSPSLVAPEPYMEQTRKIFARAYAGTDGKRTTLTFSKDE